MTSQTTPFTLPLALRQTARLHGDVVGVRTVDDSVRFTWREVVEESDALAGGLRKLGVQRGSAVALMMGNRPEFHIADMAVVTAGGTPFSIYQTYTPEQIAYVVRDAGAKVIIVSVEYLDVVRKSVELIDGGVDAIIGVDAAPDGVLAWADVSGSNPDFDADAAAAEVLPDDILTLIYTSGTTGPPKGVELTHRGTDSVITACITLAKLNPGENVISWLPAAHVAERVGHHYGPIVCAGTITCCPDPREIVQFLPQVRPHFFFAVPRIWEKLKAGLEAMLESQPAEQAAPLRSALDDSLKAVRLKQNGQDVPAELAAKVAASDEQVFSNIRTMFGLDRARFVGVGAAPTPPAVIEFFHAIGIHIAEVWGMSETSGIGTANPPEAVRIGTVGPPIPGAEVVIAEDGEVLIRGELIMRGYRNKPEATSEAIDADGWLHTGDIGAFDDAGYLKIVDRKKEIIINAAGKNMSPANIEAAVKTSSPLIGQACVIGDARPYNTALIVLDPDVAPVWAAQNGVGELDQAALAASPELKSALDQAIEIANSKLARVEQIKKYTVLSTDWAPGGEELTPTMKLKRKPIAEKYASQIEELYS